jgi:hypothetical protein
MEQDGETVLMSGERIHMTLERKDMPELNLFDKIFVNAAIIILLCISVMSWNAPTGKLLSIIILIICVGGLFALYSDKNKEDVKNGKY